MTPRAPFVLALALAAGSDVLLPSCSRRELPGSPSSSASAIALPPPSESGAAPAGIDAARVRVEPTSSRTKVFELPFRAVQVVAGAAPSRELPGGTLIFAKTAEDGFALVEWDASRARTVREVTHPHQPGDGIQVGNTHALARTGSGFAYATTGYEDPSPIELWLVGRDLAARHHRVIDVASVDARRPALHGSGDTLALSYCARGEHRLVTLDVPSGKVVGRRKLGRTLSLCVGFTTPLADVRVVDSSVWSVSGGLSDYELLTLSRDLSRVLARRPIPTPGLDAEARESAIDAGVFPRFDVSAGRMTWNTRGELRMSGVENAAPIWKARVDPASISAGPVSAPEEMDFPVVIDPETGAAFLGDGTWYAPDGVATRVFRAHDEQPALAPVPVQHRRYVTFAHGRGVYLAVAPQHATLVLVEPQRSPLDGGS